MQLPDIKIEKILYATDLSPNAYHAFGYAVNLASRYNAQLSMIHVIEDIPDFDSKVIGYISQQHWEEIKRQHEDEARSSLTGKLVQNRAPIEKLLGQLGHDARQEAPEPAFKAGEILVKRGNPVEQILKQVNAADFDLIVLGTHGHGAFADAMMGSTSRRVLRRCLKPVLLVRLPE
ncbi:MAG: universal stress protein [Desulfobacterales bacterium]|nr:universal stress protein [Desulfobacterales bacterium]